jgi:hypothetical protein
LDHDLGHHYIDVDDEEDAIYLKGDSEDDGFQLVKWLCENYLEAFPLEKITIHSWNPVGAENMASYLTQFVTFMELPVEIDVMPYQIPS